MLSAAYPGAGRITETDLEGLPAPVARHLRAAGVVGHERNSTVRLEQEGSLRMGPDQAWTRLTAEQHTSVNPPGFVWYGKLHPAPLASVSAMDSFLEEGDFEYIRIEVMRIDCEMEL